MIRLLEIIITFIKIQLLSFGGGHASIPVVQAELVEIKNWLSAREFLDLLAMDELTPGPLAINCATFVGMKLAGTLGAVAATVGCVIPSCALALTFSKIYSVYLQNMIFVNELKGLRCMVIAMLAATTIVLAKGSLFIENAVHFGYVAIFGLSYFLLARFRPNPLLVILLGGVLGIIINVI